MKEYREIGIYYHRMNAKSGIKVFWLLMDSRDLEFWWQSGGYNTYSD
ncbi:hypothetical protein [Chroococcidiopsis sp. CCMEE 29]|nr:hypothetical protein [Chroococcidiopsis sp. CCMEE 29]